MTSDESKYSTLVRGNGYCGEIVPRRLGSEATWTCSLDPGHPGKHKAYEGYNLSCALRWTWGNSLSTDAPFRIIEVAPPDE